MTDVSKIPVVYIAGPYRAENNWEIEQNIRRAEALALAVWGRKCAAMCPHANTRFFQGAAPDEVWLLGDLAMLAKCDAMLVVPNWEKSWGTRAEIQFAQSKGIPVFYTMNQLILWRDLDFYAR